MASFVCESVANDDSDDNHITLSLGCLDTESDNNLDLDNLSDVSPRRPRKSIYLPREPRWPPREPTRRSSRESTCRSTRASISRPPTPPRSRDHNRRARRNRSPSYSPPSEQQVRARSPDPDERVGDILKLRHETYQVAKYRTKEGTYRSNVTFSPRLVPNRICDNLSPAQSDFVSKRQTVHIANIGTPQSHQINLYNCPPSVHISISNYQVCDRSPRGSN